MLTDKEFRLFLQTFGKNVKRQREKAGLTQEDIAELVEYKYYQKIEAGKVNITLKTVYKICKKLNIKPADLFKLK